MIRLLLSLAGTACALQKVDGLVCDYDSQCESFCCNNDNDFSRSGVCIDVHEDERCQQRMERDQLTLKYLVGLFVFTVVSCGLIKFVRDREHRKSINAIKIKAIEDSQREDKL